jgi:hypothetical protein
MRWHLSPGSLRLRSLILRAGALGLCTRCVAQWLFMTALLPLTILLINMSLPVEDVALQIDSILSTDHIYLAIGTGVRPETGTCHQGDTRHGVSMVTLHPILTDVVLDPTLRAAAHLLAGAVHAVMPLPCKALRVSAVLNVICNELALAHLWWAGSGHLPLGAVWRLALLYSVPNSLGFCGVRALMAGPPNLCRIPLPSWASGSPRLWYNMLAPALVAFLAWGTEVY